MTTTAISALLCLLLIGVAAYACMELWSRAAARRRRVRARRLNAACRAIPFAVIAASRGETNRKAVLRIV